MTTRSYVRARLLVLLAVLGCVLAAGAFGYRYGERVAASSLQESEGHKLDLYVDSLRGELARYAFLPAVIAQNRDVISLMKQPVKDRASISAVNDYLDHVNKAAQATASYLIDRTGRTIVASNWQEKNSFVGMDFSYRPYFKSANAGSNGHFFGIGAAGAEPGYYFSTPVRDGREIVGISAVKINLDSLHDFWLRSDERLLVLDGNGIAFLSTVPEWRYKALRPLSARARKELVDTRQYNEDGIMKTIGFKEIRSLTADAMLIESAKSEGGHVDPKVRELYLAQTRLVPGTDWSVMVLSSVVPIVTSARTAAAASALAVLFITSLIVVFYQRRRAHVHAKASRQALELAKLSLEDQVVSRTQDLVDANALLTAQVQERLRAEQALKSATDGLVQAAKLATLGQMSAGVTHELNQPLAALRTLTDNAIKMMDRGLHADARSNLVAITQLVMRMAKITGQLRKFARKSPAGAEPVAVGSVVNDALFLLEQRIRQDGVMVRRMGNADTLAICDANRLEQVLINLMSNAIDAMETAEGADQQKVLTIAVDRNREHVLISVRDTGTGITPEVQARLYEPFFSTKRQGAGLGLGLTISLGIVQEFGGSIAARGCAPGAEFIVSLKAA
ncbi:ATP-binding protein [Burkholderiaceae bacterium]